uniref:G-protein coupled receptors family 1 profile domain-containing protein n=1 Tax=Acrobeloides nanus TaxID=290746 RepID=A0A914BWR7_9BILA
MRRSVMNMLLLNLAIADALNLITTTVEWTPTIILGYTAWIFPNFLCPIARYFECVFLFTSIMTQLIVCIERYIAIVYPMHARRLCSKNNILIAITIVWLFVLMFAAPYAHFNVVKKRKNSDTQMCVNPNFTSPFWLTYKKIEFFGLYVFPCIVFIVLYSKISCVLWSKNKELYEEHSRSEALVMRRNVVKMLVACVCVYFICYSPIQGIFLSKWLFSVQIHPPYEFILLMNALAMTCSACNPLLYTLFSRKFRVRIATILMCTKPGSRNCVNEYTNSFYKPGEKSPMIKSGIMNETTETGKLSPNFV